MKKRVLALVLSVLFLLSIPMPVHAAQDAPAEFSGTRTTCFTADWSDLENYVNGGRSAFELLLRRGLPQWAAYSIHTEGHDVRLELRFSFDSLEDYRTKLSALLLREPSLVCMDAGGLLLIENLHSADLLNFAAAQLENGDRLSERTLDQIFFLTGGTLLLNGETHTIEDSVFIHPEGYRTVQMDALSVDTTANANGSFTRTICARLLEDQALEDDMDILEGQFSQVGEVRISSESSAKVFQVTFDALSQSELEEKTMLCLNAATFIEERQQPGSSNTVHVDRTEFFDLSRLLRPEGTFSFYYAYPSHYTDLTTDNAAVVLHEACITAQDTDFISCSYERKFQFSAVEILTDLSHPFGKYQRTITCTAPVEIAAEFHSSIRDKFGLKLVNGCELLIFDEGAYRHYQISFSSWSLRQLEDFTAAILGDGDYALELTSSWVPFGKCSISDHLDTDGLISKTIPADDIRAVYVLSALSKPDQETEHADHVRVSGKTISYSIRSDSRMSFSYRQLHIGKTLILLTGLLFLLALLFLILHPRKRTAKAKHSPRVIYCNHCGTPAQPHEKYCNHCGQPLDH